MHLTVGVDVGGTNTDAVIVRNAEVLCSAKTPTTNNVTSGVATAIASALDKIPQEYKSDITRVNIGTTHFVNAVIQRRNIVPVAVLRLCGPASSSVPPFCDFPDDLKTVIAGPYYFLSGGYEFDGREITKVDEQEVKHILQELQKVGIKNVVVAGIFSPVCGEQERHVADIIHQSNPEMSITLSHEVGLLGLLGRENAAILNESLKPLCAKTVAAFHHALHEIGLKCPFYLTQNDGTVISAQRALQFPVFTFASGPTNSMRGAAHLSNRTDAIVIDIGGTTTDVGVLRKGFPRQASTRVEIAGVNTNFRMPDVLSIGLGGGSHVVGDSENNKGNITVGPLSVGYRLLDDALVFGGNILTATDIAVAASLCDIGKRSKVQHINKDFTDRALETMRRMIEDAIDQVKISREDQPVILVGGGSILIDLKKGLLKGASEVTFPQHYQVANAVGAALSKVSGTVDHVVSLANTTEKEATQAAEVLAHEKAVQAGADADTVQTVDVMTVMVSYLPGNATRIQVTAVGDLAESHGDVESSDAWRKKTESQEGISPSEQESATGTELPEEGTGSHAKEHEGTNTDDVVASTNPHIDPNTGDWIVSAFDVDCMAIGAGIMGCGGGGNPYLGRLTTLELLKSGKELRVIHPDRLGTTPELSGPLASIAFMGAPAVLIEKIPGGNETITGLTAMQALMTAKKGQVKEEEKAPGTKNVTNIKDLMTEMQQTLPPKPFNVVVCAEVGGFNSMVPLIVAAECGIPVVDADGMGRAFPELQMLLPFVYGCDPYPAAVADATGAVHVASKADTAKDLENFFRIKTVEFGCSASFCVQFSCEDVKHKFVRYSLSRAWRLGNAVLQARRNKTSPIDAILAHEGGKLLFTGKIVECQRKTEHGFTTGRMTVEGATSQTHPLIVEFQNENYLAYFLNTDNTKNVLASVPDLITVVDSDKGDPIPTEEIRYGLRVAVIGMRCSPLWTTSEALAVVGPAAFGYSDVKYQPIGDYIEHPPIPRP